jgi:hypothetical protein
VAAEVAAELERRVGMAFTGTNDLGWRAGHNVVAELVNANTI